jgi:hypothetical protein
MQKPTPFVKPLERPVGKKFAEMTGLQKAVFVGRVIICVATFGFAFPNVQTD